MEEEDTKQCTNCKREIPSVNFTTHSVHCARNLRSCPVCKEPVPLASLQQHHDALHKEVPCKKCGESVCGTDLEDHIRDSCSQTIKPCRYCELELPRQALPAHETYCGARSEQCPECREYVMLKYRQLHLDSNHGFLRLDDDPTPKEAKPKPNTLNGFAAPSTSRLQNRPLARTEPTDENPRPNRPDNFRPITQIRYYDTPGSSNDRVTNSDRANDRVTNSDRATNFDRVTNSDRVTNFHRVTNSDRVTNFDRVTNTNGTANVDNIERNGKVPAKRTNDQPQINTSVEPREKVHKELPSRGAVKKRPAPPPPAPPLVPAADPRVSPAADPRVSPAADPRRDLPYWSVLRSGAQDEERTRQEQTAYNLSVGLPPVLSPAAKLEKLRKMDALHNREVQEDYSHKLQGRVWQPLEPDGYRLGDDLSHLRPMTAQQFMDRFQELQVGAVRRPRASATPAPAPTTVAGGAAAAGGKDRFSEIKSSLRELRRGLNEVTAPYNSASNVANNTQIDSNRLCPPSPPLEPLDDDDVDADNDMSLLPCEFCARAVPLDQLVLHQTGCRPDLAQYKPASPSRSPPPSRSHAEPELEPEPEPVIPCEFCAESLPIYLISEHQERCRRELNILYGPD